MHAARPDVSMELWINELLPDDVKHFAAIKGPTKAVTITIKHVGTNAVKRQRVDVKGDFGVTSISALLQTMIGTDVRYWTTSGPLNVGVVGDNHRAIVTTSWGSGTLDAGGASQVYTLEEGKWRYLYRCCKEPD
ncbi:MAG: hypothetical protein ABI616_11720 [Pseudomonadota bacterium]